MKSITNINEQCNGNIWRKTGCFYTNLHFKGMLFMESRRETVGAKMHVETSAASIKEQLEMLNAMSCPS